MPLAVSKARFKSEKLLKNICSYRTNRFQKAGHFDKAIEPGFEPRPATAQVPEKILLFVQP